VLQGHSDLLDIQANGVDHNSIDWPNAFAKDSQKK
jgi:hypothetical protein